LNTKRCNWWCIYIYRKQMRFVDYLMQPYFKTLAHVLIACSMYCMPAVVRSVFETHQLDACSHVARVRHSLSDMHGMYVYQRIPQICFLPTCSNIGHDWHCTQRAVHLVLMTSCVVNLPRHENNRIALPGYTTKIYPGNMSQTWTKLPVCPSRNELLSRVSSS
jgi:hypothetical protein